jgi:MYXO-CTERM domain-containing protein
VGQDESTFSIVDGVNIATPQDDQTVRIARPTFTGVAAPNTSVEIYLNDTLVATVDADENGDWTYTPDSDLADGPWEVRVEGIGESTDSVTFDVDTTRTGLVIDSPAEGALLNEDTVTFNGTALPGATVTITIDGVEVGTVTADQNGAWEWESPAFDDGDYTVEVTSVNEVDEPQTASRSITIDTTPPSLGLTSPADGESFPEDGVLSGTSEPGATVQVFVNGTQVGETTADENGEWTFELPEGTDTSSGGSLRVTSTDEAGNTTSIEREVAPSTPEFDGRVLAGGAGCSVAPTGDDMSPWLLLLGVFGWRMRRRR